ncbi:MAG: UDP-N-acetylmuramate dehydrogenase [Bacteroidales bacterium]|nr:UDP-N-acetylmuramate dehydrogenase [Bacteroidales bacterium]
MIEENKDLSPLTTFHIPAKARFYAEYTSEKELLRISRDPVFIENEVLHIGGGSNLLFCTDYDGLVLHSAVKGMKAYQKDAATHYAIVGAGEKWSDFVEWTIDQGLGGLENLAGIPGEAGASAVQNVGAYGVEAGDCIHTVECFDCQTRTTRTFTKEECRFGYRDSFFKHEGKGRYIVLRVAFKLQKESIARTLTYGPLKEWAASLDHSPSLRETADKIKEIRNTKLPDPDVLGSAGSFFKNPVVRGRFHYELEQLSSCKIPAIPLGEPDETGHYKMVKIPAAWLIDKAGLKGRRIGGARVYPDQPLVIVNEGNASSRDVVELAETVRKEVKKKFFIDLLPEVNYIDTDIRVTVLGSGTSKGVPEIGCSCEVCTSPFEKDKRLRASILVETHGLRLLIDASPDLRMQALTHGIDQLDAVILTHVHYDHVGGIDDLRPYCAYGSLPIYLREDVAKALRQRLDYCFRDQLYPGVPALDLRIIGNHPFYIKGLKIEPIEVLHGQMPIYGYRIGKFAYITDAKSISETEKEKLEGLDTIIVNALRERNHFAHFTIREALNLIEELKPRRAYLTHFNHEAGRHHELLKRLPSNVEPCYDGLKITIK